MVEDGLHSARSPQSRNKPDTEDLLAPSSEELIADVEDLRRDELALKKLRIQNMIDGNRDRRSRNDEESDEPDEEDPEEGNAAEPDWNEESLENDYLALVASWRNSETAIEEFVQVEVHRVPRGA